MSSGYPNIQETYHVKYLGGHLAFSKKFDVQILLFSDHMEIVGMSLKIPYGRIWNLQSGKRGVTAKQYLLEGVLSFIDKESVLILSYQDEIGLSHDMVFSCDVKNVLPAIYRYMIAAKANQPFKGQSTDIASALEQPLTPTPQPVYQPPLQSEAKQATKTSRIVIAIVVIAIISAIVYIASGSGILSLGQNRLTVVRVTQVITIHTLFGTTTSTNVVTQDKAAGQYPAGRQIVISWPIYNAVSSSTLQLTKVECNTVGFRFAGSSPALPFTAPNTGSTLLELTFDTPSTPYNGPFDYTLYLDYSI